MLAPGETSRPSQEESVDPDPLEGDELQAVIQALRRNLALILLVVAVSTAVAAVRTYRLVPVYAATARLHLAKEAPDPTYARFVTYWEGIQQEYLNTQIAILRSRPLAAEVLEKNPAIAKELMADLVAPGQETSLRDEQRQEVLVWRFLGGVGVTPVKNTYLVDITYESEEPTRCPRYANALAESYIALLDEQAGSKSRLVEEKIGEQAQLLFEKLGKSEAELRQFLEQLENPMFERYEELLIGRISANNESLAAAQNGRIKLDAELDAIARVLRQGRPIESAPAVAENPLIGSLRTQLATVELEIATETERYGDQWPPVRLARARRDQLRLLIQQEIETIRAGLAAKRDQTQAEEEALLARATQLREEARRLGDQALRYQNLKGEVEANRRFYEEFATRLKELTHYSQVSVSNARVVDPAVPGEWVQVRPNHSRNIAMGFALGLAAAVVLVLLLERLADKIRSASEVQRALGLPILSVVPEVTEVASAQLDLYSLTRPHSVFAESFRRLRVQLAAVGAWPADGAGVLLCSSGVPREGKTLCAIGLAIAEAQAGKRVLLIDADLRGPRVHRTFELPLSPGLGEVLCSKALWGTALHATPTAQLSVMTGGTSPDNPGELLARGVAFGDLIARLRGHFDRIIIDTPPVAAFSDATLMAPFVDSVLLVVSARSSRRTASVLARTELARVGSEPVGVVFNHQGASQGGYYYHYYYRYGPPRPEPSAPQPGPEPEAEATPTPAVTTASGQPRA